MRAGSWPRVALLFAVLSLGGCGTSTPSNGADESYQPLVRLDAWSAVARRGDPFIDESNADAASDCVAAGFHVEAEQEWLELDTGACNWITLTARSGYVVDSGQSLRLRVSHYDLDAPAPAQAELGLRFGECDVWSAAIAIPGPANVDEEELNSPCALGPGADVFFHVSNHGQNTYQLQALEVLR